MRRPQRRYQLPPLVSHPLDDVWSVIVPIARTNLVTNPSFETNTTNWQDIVGTMARSTLYQYHGAYSLQMTPDANTTDGVRYGLDIPLALTNGTTYAYSCKFKGQAGLKYTMNLESSTFANRARVSFVATGRWQWITGFYTEGATAALYWSLRKDTQANTTPYYIDGVQVEACAAGEVFPTTYIDGDQVGLVPNQYPPAYAWAGTPHASTSSRSGLTRAGGRVVKFKDFGWFLMAIIGLGLATPQNQAMDYAALDGGQDLGTRKPTRQFTLVGQFAANTYGRLRENRGDLAALLDRDLSGADQRLKLRYQAMRGCDLVGEEAEVICKYAGGLEGDTNGHFGSTAPITFTQYLPVVTASDNGATLSVQASVANANGFLQRTAAGQWRILGTTMLNVAGELAQAWALGLDGTFYLGGNFGDMDGVANTIAIAKWNGSAWSALGTGGAAGAIVAQTGLAIGPDGSLYAGGTWTLMGGVANTVNIARWNGSAWSALGTGTNGLVRTVIVGPDGTVYAGGDFALAGGVANTVRVAKWNGSAWSALSTGANASVYQLGFGKDGYLYAVGNFTTIGGVAANGVAKWDGSAWSALGTGSASGVFALAFDQAGNLYVGGAFTSIGGVNANGVAMWNGVSWAPLGSGLNAQVNALSFGPDNTLYAAGLFTTAGGIALPESVARWNGAAWLPLDVDLPSGGGTGYYIAALRDGTINVGYPNTGTATAAALTTITNTGTGRAYPTLIIKGPSSGTSRIYQIVNYTTGRAIYLNYTINAGETAILRFEPDNLSFMSDFVGNLASTILPGSSEADFFLQPGDNSISFFAAGSTVTATLQWRPAYLSLDDH